MVAGRQMVLEEAEAVAVLELNLQEDEAGEIMEESSPPPPEPTTNSAPVNQVPAKWVTASSHKEIQKANGTAPSIN